MLWISDLLLQCAVLLLSNTAICTQVVSALTYERCTSKQSVLVGQYRHELLHLSR